MSREQQAAELRARISAVDPDLLSVIDGLKECFNASLRHIVLGDFELGKDNYKDGGIVPATSQSAGLTGRDLRAAEQLHIAQALEARARSVGGPARRRARGVR